MGGQRAQPGSGGLTKNRHLAGKNSSLLASHSNPLRSRDMSQGRRVGLQVPTRVATAVKTYLLASARASTGLPFRQGEGSNRVFFQPGLVTPSRQRKGKAGLVTGRRKQQPPSVSDQARVGEALCHETQPVPHEPSLNCTPSTSHSNGPRSSCLIVQ